MSPRDPLDVKVLRDPWEAHVNPRPLSRPGFHGQLTADHPDPLLHIFQAGARAWSSRYIGRIESLSIIGDLQLELLVTKIQVHDDPASCSVHRIVCLLCPLILWRH